MRSPAQVVALCATFVLALSVVSAASAASFSRSQESSLVSALNRVRREHGLPTLRYSDSLHRAARSHSMDMMRRGYFGHGPFARRLSAFGVRAPLVGENIAWGTGPAGKAGVVLKEWMASPEHRANVLRPGFRSIGVGTAIGNYVGRWATVVTADFSGG
jgi:uncharacterized protein YkwD